MAPFAPFLAETVYQYLPKSGKTPDSVHLCEYPVADITRMQPKLEQAVERMQHIILLGRQKRNQEKVKTKVPLACLTIIHRDKDLLAEIARLENYIKAELNVKMIEYSTNESEFITLYAKPNSSILGRRLGKSFKRFKQLIEKLDTESINQYLQTGQLVMDNEVFTGDDILVFREAKTGSNVVSNRFVSIELNCELDDALIAEGLAREVVNRIQKTRKDQGFQVADRIEISLYASPDLMYAINQHKDYIMQETLALSLSESETAELRFDIDGHQLGLSLALVR